MLPIVHKLQKSQVKISFDEDFAEFLADDPRYSNERILLPLNASFSFGTIVTFRFYYSGERTHFSNQFKRQIHLDLRDLILKSNSYEALVSLESEIEKVIISLDRHQIQYKFRGAGTFFAPDLSSYPLVVSNLIKISKEQEAREKIEALLEVISNSISGELKTAIMSEFEKIKESTAYQEIEKHLWLTRNNHATNREVFIDLTHLKPEYETMFRHRFKDVLKEVGFISDDELSKKPFNALFQEGAAKTKINWKGHKSHLAFLASKLMEALNNPKGYVTFSELFKLDGKDFTNVELRRNYPTGNDAKLPTQVIELIEKTSEIYTK